VTKIRLDPENRLVENNTYKDGKNSKYDNYHPSPPWRFIFSGFEALFNVTELATRIYMDGDFKPRHDLSRWLNILFFRDEITEFGLGISWLRYFGRNINNTRLAHHLDFGFQGSLTRPLKNNQDIRSIKSTAFIRYMWNTRRDFMLPTQGSWGFVKGAANIYFHDYNYEENSQNYELFSLMCKYFNLPQDATLALYLGGGIKGGEFYDQIELLTLTGPSYLQGYRSDEFYGKSMAFASAELRHLIVKNPDLTLLGMAHLTRVSGGIYFGAGGICGDDDHIFNKNCRLASSFGYGIRLHGKWFGLYEGLLNFKLTFPLHKHETTRNNYIFFISLEPKF
jgi:outer membrane protein assembly factor BamA